MQAEANKELIRRYYDEAYNTGDIEGLADFIAPDIIDHSNLAIRGLADIQQNFAGFVAALPDFHSTIQQLVAEDDKVVAYTTLTFTHTAEFMGVAPTGKRISIETLSIFRIADNKVVERWGISDNVGVMRQLGILPAQEGET